VKLKFLTSRRLALCMWVLAAAGTTLFILPQVAKFYQTTERRDFEQEWLSARNYLNGHPIYESAAAAMARYPEGPKQGEVRLSMNAHPPTSILLGIPLAWMSYSEAFLLWNLFSLLMLAASLLILTASLGMKWDTIQLLRAYVLVLVCGPLNHHMYEGQINLMVLLLIVGAWTADRSGRQATAGLLLGAAAAIKLFPALLFLYFALRRRWRPIVFGLISVILLTLLTVGTLGSSAYRDYMLAGMRAPLEWRSNWGNVSLLALWSKLFDPVLIPGLSSTIPVVQSSVLSQCLTLACNAAVVIFLCRAVLRARSRSQCDLAFAMFVPAMILISPVAWDHYFVLLLLPLVLLSRMLPPGGIYRWDLRVIGCVLWMYPSLWWYLFIPGYTFSSQPMSATWRMTIGALSIPTYAVIGLFTLGLMTLHRAGIAIPAKHPEFAISAVEPVHAGID
jgi:hypothetical protein